MKVLLTGANGFIGSAVLAALRSAGHEVVPVTRSPGALLDAVAIDIARATRAEDWLSHLAGCDAVVNCAGLLQDAPGMLTEAVHVRGTAALFAACEAAGVRRVIHISAVGIEREQPTEFSRTKLIGDELLMARDLDWIILRPSVVVGRAAYGGSALLRGLAALPILPVVPGSGPLQIVQIDDLVCTVLFFLSAQAPTRLWLDIVGPERLDLTEVVLRYRRWLGWRPPRLVRVPGWLAGCAFRLGDLIGWLGWRPPIRSTAQLEIARGAVGDGAEWQRLTGISAMSLGQALGSASASVQERWFARLYLVKPFAFALFAAFWIATGLIALGPGRQTGIGLMKEAGLGSFSAPLTIAGGLADVAIGVAISVRRTTRLGLLSALALTLAYLILATALLPGLWLEPLGPLMKLLPIAALNTVLLAIYSDR